MRRVTPENAQQEEEIFLDFLVHLAVHSRKAAGTIKQHLSAVRAQHIALGYPDPTAPLAKMWVAVDGLRRRQGGPRRKKAVTKQMLTWIRRGLRPRADHDEAMLWAATLLAFFFLLRGSEYTASDQSGNDSGKGVRGADLQGKLRGELVTSFSVADEVVLKIRGSKTDQFNRGEWRNHFRRKGNDAALCVVEALA